MDRIRKKPEILAPAGSIESLKGAVAAGADAIYIGGSRFGARAFAENPVQEELLSAIDYVHTKDRRIYLTVNTLMKEQEVTKELEAFILPYYKAGIDAVIVQDVGVLHFLAAHFPDLPVHASTQMTLVSADGAKWLKDYPVTRMVPARELSLEEIKGIRKETDLEIECFVHGALCYCYSGQCLLSSMIGGRSGNRGRCAQPCRMPYTVYDGEKRMAEGLYALSPKDICTLDMIPELVAAGIDSYKIEGRMKRPEYTAGVTAAYRLLTDLYFEYGEEEFYQYIEKHPEVIKEQTTRVADLYNRGGFTKGYYVQYHGKPMMSMDRPNHSGVKVGEVDHVQGIRAKIRLTEEIFPQDVLEIRADGEEYEFTVGKAGIEERKGFYETNVKKGFPVRKGQPVYRTKNETLLSELFNQYVEKRVQLPVVAEAVLEIGKPVRLTVSASVHKVSSLTPGEDAGNIRTITVVAEGDMVSEAQNQPVAEEKIQEQLSKTGESEFYFEQLSVRVLGNCFIPMGKLKELRRSAFEQLTVEILSGYRRADAAKKRAAAEKEFDLSDCATRKETEVIALVSTKEQWDSVMAQGGVTTVYVDLQNESPEEQVRLTEDTKKAGKKAFLVMPHIFRKKEKERYEREAKRIGDADFDGFLVKSLEELTFLKENGFTERFEIRLNYNLYAFQAEAKQFFREAGFSRFTAPVELNEEELKEYDVSDCDFILYGRMPVMVSAQCVRDNVVMCQKGRKTDGLLLSDRVGAKFPVRQICTSCYNVIYNSACFSLLGMGVEERFVPAGFRFDFTLESGEEVKQVLRAFCSGVAPEQGKGPFTKGHFKRGIE